MLANRYMMVRRVMDGVSVKFYDLQDGSGEICRFTKDETEMLALRGLIINVKAQRNNGTITMKGKDGFKIKDLETINMRAKESVDMRPRVIEKIKIEGNREIAGYTLLNFDGTREYHTARDVIQAGMRDGIKNIRINRDGDRLIVRGVGCNLNAMPVIKTTAERFYAQVGAPMMRRG